MMECQEKCKGEILRKEKCLNMKMTSSEYTRTYATTAETNSDWL